MLTLADDNAPLVNKRSHQFARITHVYSNSCLQELLVAKCLMQQKRYPDSFSRYLTLAMQGIEEAIEIVVWCYLNGLGPSICEKQARFWLKKIDLKTPRSCFANGYLLILERDEKRAHPWLQYCASKNFLPALFMLGYLAELRGEISLAYAWYARAAKFGHLWAKASKNRDFTLDEEDIAE